MCIFHAQNKTKKVSSVMVNYIIYFYPVTLEFLKLLHEKCLGRAQSMMLIPTRAFITLDCGCLSPLLPLH